MATRTSSGTPETRADYLYSHLDHEFKGHMLSFEYTYDERSGTKYGEGSFSYDVGSLLGFIQFNGSGMFEMLPESLLIELVTYYAVKKDFRDKEIETAYKESPYINGVKIRSKNYFLYKMCDRYWSMLDPEVRNVIDPHNRHNWYLCAKTAQDNDYLGINFYKY